MNLPAHGTTSPDLSVASLSIKTTRTSHNLQRNRLAQHPALLGNTGPDCLAIFSPPLGASALPASLFSQHCLAEHSLAARRHAV